MRKFWRVAGVLIALLLAGACGIESSDNRESVRLLVFNCGEVRVSDEGMRSFGIDPSETDVREMAIPCYVIEHSGGRLLWDAGLPFEFAELEGWTEVEGTDGAFQVRLEKTLAKQLDKIGLGMDAFDYVAFSHMHFDHVGAANELKSGTVIMQRAEYDAAFAEEVEVFGFDRRLYEGLRNLNMLIILGEHDVFGDGRVRILPAPGHTPGHQVLYVELQEAGPIVLSGDLYHFRLSRSERRVPNFNVDHDKTIESMMRVEEFVQDRGAELWIQHEMNRFLEQRKAPYYYR